MSGFSQETPNRLADNIYSTYDFLMAVEKTTKALSHLLPTRGLGPRAFAVNGLRLLVACIVLTYFALSPSIFLDGMGLQSYTSLFVTAVGLALVPMIAIVATTWLMYIYLYASTVPIVRSMERGRSLATSR